MSDVFVEHDITQGLKEPLSFTSNDFVLFTVPVYSGRVPVPAVKYLKDITGNNTPGAVVCVYGNRDIDDALLELQDITEANGFDIIGGAAFITRHSIFTDVAKDRPDTADLKVIKEFAEKCLSLMDENRDKNKVEIRGNRPYKVPGSIPFEIKTNRKCNECGICAKRCPVGAIAEDDPRKTDSNLCFLCMRCINVCPKNARSIGGLIYKIANRKFRSKCAERKEPELFF